jgi:hypothetical protein
MREEVGLHERGILDCLRQKYTLLLHVGRSKAARGMKYGCMKEEVGLQERGSTAASGRK